MRLSILFLLSSSLAARAAVDFSHQIVPILREHCVECHAGDKKKGGFSFNDRAALIEGGEDGVVVIAGKSGESQMIHAILSKDPDEQMPPKGKRMPAEQITLLKEWIDSGIAWEEGFAFKKPAYEPPLKPRSPTLPSSPSGWRSSWDMRSKRGSVVEKRSLSWLRTCRSISWVQVSMRSHSRSARWSSGRAAVSRSDSRPGALGTEERLRGMRILKI